MLHKPGEIRSVLQRTCHHIPFSHILRILGVLIARFFHPQNAWLFFIPFLLLFCISAIKVEALLSILYPNGGQFIALYLKKKKKVSGKTYEIKAPYKFHLFGSVLQFILKKNTIASL